MSRRDARAINTILWKDWDPIGCHVPEDEYEDYVWPVYRLLMEGASRERVGDYLRHTATVTIGMPAVDEAALAVTLDKLMALGLGNPGPPNPGLGATEGTT